MEQPTLSHTHQYLLGFGIKPSVQRTAVMNYLLSHMTHPTVDDIYTALSPTMPTLSKTTVYNTLNLFLEKGAVRMLTIDERNARYDADISHHAHMRCRMCDRVYDLRDVQPALFSLPRVEGFDIEAAEISYVGICPECKAGKKG